MSQTELELALANDTTPYWHQRILDSWRESVEGIFRTGDCLVEANADPRCRFDELPFSGSAKRKLICVANKEWLRDCSHGNNLPANWTTLYALSTLDDEELDAHLELGEITPELERSTVTSWAKKDRRAQRELDLAERTTAVAAVLGKEVFGVIYADPPWRLEPYSRETGMDRAADNHYLTMTLDDIKALVVPSAPDCVLFLWATVPMLPQALEVMEAWGFTYKSHCVWAKDKLGTGYWFRNCHELLLVGTKGDVPAPAPGEQYASIIEAEVGEHSQKPFQFREIIEEMFPTVPRIELFAREVFAGWKQWGNEVDAHEETKSMAYAMDSPQAVVEG